MSRPFNVLRFWRFVAKRQRGWAAKNGLCAPPRDPVLARAKFTNVFRALDRGTLFAIQELLPLEAAHRAWAVVMYRAMNRIDAFRDLLGGWSTFPASWQPLHYMAFQPELFIQRAARRREDNGKVFTGVYQSTRTLMGFAIAGTEAPMDRRLAAYGAELSQGAARLADHLGGSFDLGEAMAQIRDATKATKLGPFAAHQAALDLQYAYPQWGDGWVHVGPGAKKGLKLLGFAPTLDDLQELTAEQPPIPWAPWIRATNEPAPLSLSDVEHALCEWQKYERIRAGGHIKGIYTPGEAQARDQWRPRAVIPPWWYMPGGNH